MRADVEWKDFFHDKSRYADIINGIGCNGVQLVKDTDLKEVDTTERKKQRDLLCQAAMGINFAIVGIENQEKVDYRFPLRNMHYDVTRYQRQAADLWKRTRQNLKGITSAEYLSRFKKENKLHPQVMFVLYAGEEEWDGSRSLHEMIDFTDIPKSLQKMVSDYKINIVDIRRLEDTSVFRTDVKQVFDFIRYSEDKTKLTELVGNDTYYQKMDDDAYNVVTKYTNSKELVNKDEYKEEGGGHNMCRAIRELMDDSREEGRLEGSRDTLITTVKSLLQNGVSYEIVRKSIKGLSDEELHAIYEDVCA